MGMLDKAKEFIDKNDEKIDKAVEKAGDLIDEKTGGKYADKIDKAQDFIQEKTGEGEHVDMALMDSLTGVLANQALNHAASAVEAAAAIAVAATATIPQLGFIHEDAGQSFVLDIADLYRAEVTIPCAFRAAREVAGGLGDDLHRPLAQRVHRDLAALLGEAAHDHGAHGVGRHQPAQELDAVHARHLHVERDNPGIVPDDEVAGLPGVTRGADDLEAGVAGQPFAEHLAGDRRVVDDQHPDSWNAHDGPPGRIQVLVPSCRRPNLFGRLSE